MYRSKSNSVVKNIWHDCGVEVLNTVHIKLISANIFMDLGNLACTSLLWKMMCSSALHNYWIPVSVRDRIVSHLKKMVSILFSKICFFCLFSSERKETALPLSLFFCLFLFHLSSFIISCFIKPQQSECSWNMTMKMFQLIFKSAREKYPKKC